MFQFRHMKHDDPVSLIYEDLSLNQNRFAKTNHKISGKFSKVVIYLRVFLYFYGLIDYNGILSRNQKNIRQKWDFHS